MLLQPRLKQCFRYEIISSEGVILLSDLEYFILPGDIYTQLVPLLDGQHSVEEIFAFLHAKISPPNIFQALQFLRDKNLIVDTTAPFPPEQAAFWELINVDLEEATKRLQEITVSIVSFGAIDPSPFHTLLTSLGIQVTRDRGDYWVVLTDNYLHEGLCTFNQEAVTHQRPWMLLTPTGTELLLGPIFLPENTGCWECLAHRLRGSRKVESYLQEKIGGSTQRSVPLVALPSTLHTALNIAATEIAKWVVCGGNENLEGRIISFDTLSLTTQAHILVQRPQCPRCGDLRAVATHQSLPFTLQSCKKAFVANGEPEVSALEETLKKLEPHISPLTGIVHTLRPTVARMGEHSLTPSYVAGHNFVHVSKDDSLDLDFLHSSLQGSSSGKGRSSLQAKVSALGEAIERYSGVFQGDEARLRAKYKDLGAKAIHPNACMLYSEEQLRDRERWKTCGLPFSWVPEPFIIEKEIEWSPVWSLTYDEPRYVPTAYCYYGYSRRYATWFARADSNGCAAGLSKEEAVLQGFIELAERDGVALWWYNRLKKPAVDLSSFSEPYFQELQAYYQTLHRDLWVLDLTSDLGITTFVAISRRNDQEEEDIILGFGAHLVPCIALFRALAELNLQLPLVLSVSSQDSDSSLLVSPQIISWWRTTTLENQPYLAPNETLPPKTQSDYPRYWSDDLYMDVMGCVRNAEEKGLDTFVLDQTRPDTGLHVVKVMVPGLRHLWPRFGPGRLYDVPVQMGWLSRPLTEEQLNPYPIYLSFHS